VRQDSTWQKPFPVRQSFEHELRQRRGIEENVLHETPSTPGRDEQSTPPRAREREQARGENQRSVIEKKREFARDEGRGRGREGE